MDRLEAAEGVSGKLAGDLSRPAQLLLVRLLAATKTAPKPAALLKDLGALLPESLSTEGLSHLREELLAADYVESKVLRLTEAGRAAGWAMLGIHAIPPGTTWRKLLDNHLFPLVAGVTREELAAAGKDLAMLFVKRQFGLPTADATKPAQVFDTLASTKLGIAPGGDEKSLRAAGLIRALGSDSPLTTADIEKHVRSGKAADLWKLLDILVCRGLGFPTLADAKSLKPAVLSRMIGSERLLTAGEIKKQLPRAILKIQSESPDAVRKTMIQRWAGQNGNDAAADGGSSGTVTLGAPAAGIATSTSTSPGMVTLGASGPGTTTASRRDEATASGSLSPVLGGEGWGEGPEVKQRVSQHNAAILTTPDDAQSQKNNVSAVAPPFDLPTFARSLKHLAQSSPATARFGDNKLFINRAWRIYQQATNASKISLDEFKTHLLHASRDGLLELSRADLVAAMNPQDVRESETRAGHAEFHFIFIEGIKP